MTACIMVSCSGKANWPGRSRTPYRHVFQGSPYQDESEGPVPHRGTERNEMYTYPGLNGPIPTIQWEGVREGIDDLRYLQTLKYWVDIADNTQNAGDELKKTADEARRLLALPPLFQRKFQELERNVQAKDFENLRAEILDKIIAIKQQVDKKLTEEL